MQYKELGKTGVKLSRLGLGCMRYPLLKSYDESIVNPRSIDINATIKMMDMAISQGVNYFDTAHMYHEGMSETILGHAIEILNAQDKVHIATKLPYNIHRLHLSLEEIFEEQCQRLRRDNIEFYLLHNVNDLTLARYEEAKVFEFLTKLKKDGRIQHLGFSFHDDNALFTKVVNSYDWDFCQIQYNYIDEDYQAGVKGLKLAHEKGLGVIVMEPLKGGALAKEMPSDIESIWQNSPTEQKNADRALRWLFNQKEVSVVLSGMNSLEQLEENIASADHVEDSMTPEEINSFVKVKRIFKSRLKFSCTSCGYCAPCPRHIRIPAILDLYNKYSLFINDREVVANIKTMYNSILKMNNTTVSHCESCNSCVRRCPQNIDIPIAIAEADNALNSQNFDDFYTGVVAGYGVSSMFNPKAYKALAETLSGDRPPVFWIQGSSCTGCSVSLLNSAHTSIVELLTKIISLDYHTTLMANEGASAVEKMFKLAEKFKGQYFVVLEGAIPLAENGKYCVVAEANHVEYTVVDMLNKLCPDAAMVFGFGTCSSYGGIPAAKGSVTDCVGLQKFFDQEGIVTPLMNVPGCPPHPDWMVGSLVIALDKIKRSGMKRGIKSIKSILDKDLRPLPFYGENTHKECPWLPQFYDDAMSKVITDKSKCRYELGCKGPMAMCDSPLRNWNGIESWCVDNSICIACVEPKFPDDMSPFYSVEKKKRSKVKPKA